MKVLLDLNFRLVPECSRRNLSFSFYVPEDVKSIRVCYAYAPKTLMDEAETDALLEEGFTRYVLPEDAEKMAELKKNCRPLVNLVTLSLDSPAGYVGAAHRHAPEQEYVLSAEDASPGFDPEKFVPGLWNACVSAHAVVTRECVVKIRVEEAEK